MRFAILLLALLTAPPARTSDFVVIANRSLSGVEITPSDVKQIFLGVKTRLSGRHVEPVIARSGGIHRQFVAALGKTESGFQNYCRMLVFTGKGSAPKSFATADEIVDYVARTEGAIGYVAREYADGTPIVILRQAVP